MATASETTETAAGAPATMESIRREALALVAALERAGEAHRGD